jgi:hypothetical protein
MSAIGGRWYNLTPSPFVCKYDFLRLTAIQRQITCPSPRLNILNFGNPRVGVVGFLQSWFLRVTAVKLLAVTTYFTLCMPLVQ